MNYTTPATHNPLHQEAEIDLAGLFHELWGHKWLLLLTMSIGLVLGTFYAMRQPAIYQSNLLLQVDSKGGSASANSIAQQLSLGSGSGDSTAAQIALIRSRFILEPVVEALGLNISASQHANSLTERLFPWQRKEVLNVEKFSVSEQFINHPFRLVVEAPHQVVLYDAEKNKVLSGPMGEVLGNESDGVNLEVAAGDMPVGTQFSLVKHSDTAAAKGLAGRLRVEETGAKVRMGSTGILEVVLDGRDKAEVVKILNTIGEIAKLKDVEKKSQEASQTLAFLKEQLPITKQLLEASENALNQYRAESGKIDIKIQTQFLLQSLAELDKQLAGVNVKKIEMQRQYQAIHPAWIALEAQVKALTTQREELEKELKKLPASDQVAVNLMRDVEVKQELYLLLLNKMQELEVIKAGTVSGVRILSYATMPTAPLPGKGRAMVVSGLFLGLMAGVLFIFTRKLLSPRVDDPHWSEKHLNLPNIAVVPFCKAQQESALVALKGQVPLLAHTQPKNLAIEALRSLRTSLQVTLACAENNVIGILGVAPSVGKSFISANLGYLLAAAGKRVLLIDSDLRKGTQHKYFQTKSSPGLSELLTQEMPLQAVARKTQHENLTLLPRGAYPKSPSELLSSERFTALIKEASAQYDLVIFDTAPILLVTDAVLVGAHASTNFLVMGAGVHQPSDVDLVYKRLQHASVHVNGTIFNFHKEQTRNYYYGKYYNYSYAAYAGETEKAEA